MQEQEREIDLRECVNMIIKRKKIIFTIFFVSVITVAIVSFLLPKIYEVSMVIELVSIGGSTKGAIAVKNISAKIREHIFDSTIMDALNLYPRWKKLDFIISQPQNSALIIVKMRQREEKVEISKKILNQLFNALYEDNKNMFESSTNAISEKISALGKSIEMKDNAIALLNNKLEILEKRENGLFRSIEEANSIKGELVGEDSILLYKDSQAYSDIFMPYMNILQQNVLYVNILNTQLTNVATRMENTRMQINNLQGDIDILQADIKDLEFKKDSIQSVIRLVHEPRVSSHPVKPNRTLNIAIAGILGCMLGIFSAFFLEYWKKAN